jgi:threonine/homoserine/homoserine lactone efflux protein
MDQVQHLGWFVLAGWLLNLTPGPDVLYIVTNGLRQGTRAGLVAALGITAGCFVHVFAAALGVGALLALSATAFTVLKWAGAAYLVWMGLRLWRSGAPKGWHVDAPATDAPVAPVGLPYRTVFFTGFWTNVLNPKVAIFFLAFVPQFIAPGAPNATLAFIGLGVLFNLNALPINCAYALLSAWVAKRVDAVQRGMHWMDRVAGTLFIAFGARLALTHAPTS